MSDPIIDPSHAIPAASQLRRSRFRWRIVAFVALVIAILAGVGALCDRERAVGVSDTIARIRDRRHDRDRSGPAEGVRDASPTTTASRP